MSDGLFDLVATDEPETQPEPAKFTERHMLDALHARYSQAPQGTSIRYACSEHVRSHGGFDARRVCDFMAQDLWPSQGLHFHGHEVKVSRSDWLRELADPSKAEEFRRYCDRWWLVVPDRRIVRDDLPDGWGLMALDSSDRLRVVKSAPELEPLPMSKTFRAALLRATAQTNAVRGSVIAAKQREIDHWRDLYERASGRIR